MSSTNQSATDGQPIRLSGNNQCPEHEHLMKSLISIMSDPVFEVCLVDHKVISCNMAAQSLSGLSPRKIQGMSLAGLFENAAAVVKALNNRISLKTGVHFVNSKGEIVRTGMQCIYFHRQADAFALLVLHDIRDPVQEEKDHLNSQLLALEVLKTRSAFFLGQEYERERLARELHSHIGPILVSVKLGMEQKLTQRSKYLSRHDLNRLLETHKEAIKQVRIVSSRLAEGFLYQEDINQAIDHLISNYAEFSDIRFHCKKDKLPENLSTTVCYHLFQIIEEALTNMVKHANATRAGFRIKVMKEQAELVIQDNGDGHDKLVNKNSNGLWIMRQRAVLIGGHLEAESVRNRFFRIRLTFPLNP